MNDGVILIDKPEGITSFTAVAIMKRRLSVKCGHSGTLDPLATGLLPIMCGKATKLCSFLTDGDKRYTATLLFGKRTDTYDITGNVLEESDRLPSLDEIKDALCEFTGTIKQTPPAFSAIKVGGKALYKLARDGRHVDVPEREITVYSIDIISYRENELVLDVACSKGTYIRSICNDLAIKLKTVGCMSALRRTETCGYSVKNAVLPDTEDIEKYIMPMDEVLKELPAFYPESFFVHLLSNGCAVETKKLKGLPSGICRVYDNDRLIGIGETKDTTFKITTHLT